MTGPQIEIMYTTVIILVILSNYFIWIEKEGTFLILKTNYF